MESHKEKTYESPTITRVELRVDEAVLSVCKANNVTTSPAVACTVTSCQNELGS